MFTDNNLRLSGSLVASAAAYAAGVPSSYPAGQTITTSGANVSTNLIDLTQHTSIGADIGEGKPLYMVWAVTTAFTRAAGALTATFQILANDDEDLTTSATVLASTDAIAKASLTIGTKVALQIPPSLGSLGLRYLGANITLSATGDAGAVTCDIVETIQDGTKFYASGFSLT